MKKVLVVVDMQNDFIDGALGSKEAQAILPNVKAKIEEYKKNNDFIFFTQDTHFDDYMETYEGKHLPVPHCVIDTKGWEISKELDTSNCPIISKFTFGSIDLANIFADLSFMADEKDVQVEFVGLCTDICVISNALIVKAVIPDATLIVDASCCAGATPEAHKTALTAMKSCHIEIINE